MGGTNHSPLKRAPEFKQNEMFPLKRNEKNTIYINESGLYGLILHSKLESTHVFRFRVAKNLIVFWLLYKYLFYIYIHCCLYIFIHIYIYIHCCLYTYICVCIIEKVFRYEQTDLLIIKYKDEIWIKAVAVATILRYKNTTKSIRDHVDPEDKRKLSELGPKSKQNEMFPLERNEKNTIYINESGLYSLILH